MIWLVTTDVAHRALPPDQPRRASNCSGTALSGVRERARFG
ncbi:Hypothetical protein A7982_00230 [Minicystis rosea]|nr:Hypothetical protein A7982_00230 [Minicystis rosea]